MEHRAHEAEIIGTLIECIRLERRKRHPDRAQIAIYRQAIKALEAQLRERMVKGRRVGRGRLT